MVVHSHQCGGGSVCGRDCRARHAGPDSKSSVRVKMGHSFDKELSYGAKNKQLFSSTRHGVIMSAE
jgi:hypothetical protein